MKGVPIKFVKFLKVGSLVKCGKKSSNEFDKLKKIDETW